MKIHLFCFDKKNLSDRVAQLGAQGHGVDARTPDAPDFFKKLKLNPPEVFIIDLSRTPSQGRDIGVYLRTAKPTRNVPLIFVGGDQGKVDKVKTLLPDASFTTWEAINTALHSAVLNRPENPVVPESAMAGYSGASLMKRLGIKNGMSVALINAPPNIDDILGPLPENVSLENSARAACALYLWFLFSQEDFQRDLPLILNAAGHGRIWMIWAKKSSPLFASVTQQLVREMGLAAGLVDYKVCAINQDWTGLLFTTRKSGRLKNGNN